MAVPEFHRLKPDSLGWLGQFAQSMAHMAPAVGIVLNGQLMALHAGPALPLASSFAAILALMLAFCLAELTRKYAGASGYFQIHSRALGSRTGFVTSWLFFLYEPFNTFVILFGFSILILEPFSATLGFHVPWWICVLAGNAVVTLLALANVKNTIRVTAVLCAVEFLVMLAFGVSLFVQAGGVPDIRAFTPAPGAEGGGGLLFATIFAFMAFIGYESGVPLTEETRASRRNTFKGLMAAVAVIGLFYVFVNMASVMAFGGLADAAKFADGFGNTPDLYGGVLAVKAFGALGPWLILFAVLNSIIGCALAAQNACARVVFALGRAGIFPAWLGRATSDGVPRNAVLAGSAFTVLVVGVFLILTQSGTLLEWFGFAGVMITLPLLIIHFLTCLSVFRAYRKDRAAFNLVRHAVLPLCAALLVLLPIGGSIYYNLTPPVSCAPLVVLAWFGAGVGVYAVLRRRHPGRLAALENEMSLLSFSSGKQE